MHNLRAFGAKIYEVMNQKDMSCSELSALTGIDFFVLKNFLNGYLFMRGEDLTNISKALDYPAKDLFDCSFDTYNKYVFKGELKSEEDLSFADALLDKVEDLIHNIRTMDLEDNKKEINDLKSKIEKLERRLLKYESNVAESE